MWLESQLIGHELRNVPQLTVETIGIGAVRLKLPRAKVDGIILAGVAGGLDPTLAVGDLVIDGVFPRDLFSAVPRGRVERGSEDFHRLDEGHRLEENPSLRDGAKRAFGKIHTVCGLICTPAEKAALFNSTRALAVDMEGAIVAKLATGLRVPFLHVRGISDTSDTELDPAMLGFVDELGRVRRKALAGTLLKRPGMIPGLMRLGSDSKRAARNVGSWLRAFLSDRERVDQWLER